MIFFSCYFSLGCSRICLATRWRNPLTVLLGFSCTFRNIRRGEEGKGKGWQENSSNAASFLSPCGFVSPSCGSSPPPVLSNSLQFINETKTCRLFRICFVLVLRFALCCGFAFLLLVFPVFSFLGGRIFNDLVG